MTGTFPGMNGQSPPMRLVIVDDHQMVLDGLKAMLRPYTGQVVVAGEASDAGEAVSLVARLEPDAVLLDVRLRGASGLDLCGDILAAHPSCKVVFLTVYDDEQYLYPALRVGAAGFLLKRIRGGELVEYLRRIGDGEVLSLLVAGLSNRAIAAKLVVSEETVKTHSRGIYRKLGVSDRAAAVTVALREGVFH